MQNRYLAYFEIENEIKFVSSEYKEFAMLTKSKLKEQIENLPEEFSIDELVERLIFVEKVERGNQDSLNGDFISESDLDNEIEKWFE